LLDRRTFRFELLEYIYCYRIAGGAHAAVFVAFFPQPTIQIRWILSCAVFALIAASLTLTVHGRTRTSTSAAAAVAVQNGQPTQATSGFATIYARSNLVVVDVVVTDSKKNPVHGLQKSDFTLMENGKPQAIRNFEEHTELPASETAKIAPTPKLPAGLFTNKSPAPANGPVNVLVLDYMNTPVLAHASAKKQLLDYLDKAPAGTRIAIFCLMENLRMLQGFTSDPAVLKAALTSKEGTAQASDILTDPVAGGPQGDHAFRDAMGPVSDDITQQMVDDMKRVDAQHTSEELNNRALYTLNAFDQLARYLAGIPGRKNVIWFSSGFPLDVAPNLNEADPNDSVVRNDDAVRKTDNMLTRAQIAVYPVDVRGLMVPLVDLEKAAAAAACAAGLGQSGCPISASAANDAVEEASVMTPLDQTAQEHLTMEAIAEDTGGHAFYNTNGLTQAVSKAIEEGSNYYTLTYSPSNVQWDERFRTIKVKVTEPGVQLTYRNGYYAVDPNDRNKVNARGAATAMATANTMSAAMMHGGPDPAEILFKVRIRPARTAPEATVLAANETNPKVKVEGPFKEYGVDLVPDAHAVNCRAGADGNRHCVLEMWTFVYNSNGEKVITASNRLHTRLTPAEYNTLLAGGMAFHQQVSVPVKGKYFLRTAIHDMVSDNVGAVEVPVDAVSRLDPLKEVAAATAR
jgi:VWFA-related protein